MSQTQQLKNKQWMEEQLRSLPFVEFDRFIIGDWEGYQSVTVYGWIDRDDDYKDFVVIIFWPENESLHFTTSSAEHSARVNECLFGSTEGHNECQRVEHSFDVSNVVELEGQNA